MANPVMIPDVASLVQFQGHDLGTTDWRTIDQAQIDAFAEATGDRQWIHIDPERAQRESPFGVTIAHGCAKPCLREAASGWLRTSRACAI